MTSKSTTELWDDLDDFDTCMLATRDGRHLRSRPMKPYFPEKDGTIHFLTSLKTHKVDEVKASPEANAVFAKPGDKHFISVSGTVRLSQDPADIDAVWSDEAEPWFENGKAEAVVLILDAQLAEYWDGTDNALKASWDKLKSSLGGERPDPAENGKVRL